MSTLFSSRMAFKIEFISNTIRSASLNKLLRRIVQNRKIVNANKSLLSGKSTETLCISSESVPYKYKDISELRFLSYGAIKLLIFHN